MRIREVKKSKVNKPRDPNFQAMQSIRKSGASGSHGDKTKDIPRKDKHKAKLSDVNESLEKDLIDMYKGDGEPGLAHAMGMSDREFAKAHKAAGGDIYKMIKNYVNVNETATAGATSAGNIATVANPHIANSKKKPKKQKPSDNALDMKGTSIFGGPIKRLNNSKETQMKKTEIQENLADMASKVEQDHEVQMARAQLYKIAKYSIKMHEMLKNVSEQEGLEGWVQSKITKAADYMGAVYHNMDYEQKFEEVSEAKDTHCSDKCCGADVKAEDCKCAPTCKHCNCNAVTEGKGKLKKGHPNYKKQAAAIAISKKANEDSYKNSLAKVLEGKVAEAKSVCKDCGKASYSTLPEEKQKGVDGKVCWKGYKRMGTKKKGGKTVDNCVKM
jgi:hypothetical protein